MLIYVIPALIAAAIGYALWPHRLEVTRVVDGDSLEGIYRGRTERIRLKGFDAPEYRQPGGREARTALVRLLEGRTIRLWLPSRDRYQRLLASCLTDGKPLSWQMIRLGHGWPEGKLGLLLSLAPRIRRKGLWSYRDAVHPSLWRAMNSSRHPADG
ncbi:thermonuclease family protein [Erythrobacter aureus]|uniref:TNase-like domain-containing protein n=1 Tax=Erythrobacter aureus TaxID=2182384 RepID=A0A345YIX0_9SPHN|nr:thermonuclease family protein [Erythrobacter aureus]AXK43872.1 hypothetical protein DVR09_15570 [Erythrobacter aureus]